jgi:hypothetical protein
MSRKAKAWSRGFGGYGSKVSVRERAGRPHLYLRWWDRALSSYQTAWTAPRLWLPNFSGNQGNRP